MAELNRGKQFEAKFKEDFKRSFPEGTIDRLYDSVSGFKAVTNISDFIGYNYPNIYYLECKSHKGKSFPFSALSQYDKLKEKVGIKGVRVGVVIWFIDLDQVYYVPIKTIRKVLELGIKSFNPESLRGKLDCTIYNYYEIPSIKKRVFLDSDYSILANLSEGE